MDKFITYDAIYVEYELHETLELAEAHLMKRMEMHRSNTDYKIYNDEMENSFVATINVVSKYHLEEIDNIKNYDVNDEDFENDWPHGEHVDRIVKPEMRRV